MRTITMNSDESIIIKIIHDGRHIGSVRTLISDLSYSFFANDSEIKVAHHVYKGNIPSYEKQDQISRMEDKINALKIALEQFTEDY